MDKWQLVAIKRDLVSGVALQTLCLFARMGAAFPVDFQQIAMSENES